MDDRNIENEKNRENGENKENDKNTKNDNVIEKQLEELLKKSRVKNNWTYLEVVEKLGQNDINEKDIKKWELGLKYPDLDMIYRLSELYQIPSSELIQAKNNSFEAGFKGINKNTIKWICYFLNVSYRVGLGLLVAIYVFLFIFALWFLTFTASHVDKNLV